MSRPTDADATHARRVPELDLLRFIAALAVMLFHFTSWEHIDTPFRLGWLGVPLFFMISGFVILWSASGTTAERFLASRASRLYPSFWVCATLTALINLDQVTLTQWLANMTLAHFVLKIPSLNDVYWTLFVEIKFYVLVFALLLFGQVRHVERWALGMLAASFVPVFDLLTLGDYGALFLTGIFLFLIWRDGPSAIRLGAFLVAATAGTLQMTTDTWLSNYNVEGQGGAAMLAMLACNLAMLVVALRWVPLKAGFYFLGSLTYPLYLIHAPLAHALWPWLPGAAWAKVLVGSVISLVAAAAIAAYTERRACAALNRALRRLFERLTPSRTPQAVAPAGRP